MSLHLTDESCLSLTDCHVSPLQKGHVSLFTQQYQRIGATASTRLIHQPPPGNGTTSFIAEVVLVALI